MTFYILWFIKVEIVNLSNMKPLLLEKQIAGRETGFAGRETGFAGRETGFAGRETGFAGRETGFITDMVRESVQSISMQ